MHHIFLYDADSGHITSPYKNFLIDSAWNKSKGPLLQFIEHRLHTWGASIDLVAGHIAFDSEEQHILFMLRYE